MATEQLLASLSDADLDALPGEYKCPITMSVLEDPVDMPCCERTVSRGALVMWCDQNAYGTTCPVCGTDLPRDFDALDLRRNLTLATLICDHLQRIVVQQATAHSASGDAEGGSTPTVHVWSGTLQRLSKAQCGLLTLRVKRSRFKMQRKLVVFCLDISGSMSGNPIRQLGTSMQYIVDVAPRMPSVDVRVVTYNTRATVVELRSATNLAAGGGTEFRCAIDKARELVESNRATSNDIVFMSDGGTMNGETVGQYVQDVFEDVRAAVNLHTVGFSGGCATQVLNSMRLGSGTFRFCEPSDGDEALSTKMAELFQLCSSGGTESVSLNLSLDTQAHPDATAPVKLDERGWGTLEAWVTLPQLQNSGSSDTAGASDPHSAQQASRDPDHLGTRAASEEPAGERLQVQVTSSVDDATPVEVEVIDAPASSLTVYRRADALLDSITRRVLTLVQQPYEHDSHNVAVTVLQTRLEDVRIETAEQSEQRRERLETRLTTLEQQLACWVAGEALDVRRLRDMQYSSLFGLSNTRTRGGKRVADATSTVRAAVPVRSQTVGKQHSALEHPTEFFQRYKRVPRDLASGNLIERIKCDNARDTNTGVRTATNDEVCAKDPDHGMNALMWAAYCGHTTILKVLLERYKNGEFPDLDLFDTNDDEETALTLAVKGRGFHRCIAMLLEAGAKLPEERIKGLLQFCVRHQYMDTHTLLQSFTDEGLTPLDHTMTLTALSSALVLYNRAAPAVRAKQPSYLPTLLALAVKQVLKRAPSTEAMRASIEPILEVAPPVAVTFDLMRRVVGKRWKDVPCFLPLAELLLAKAPDVALERDSDTNSTLLFSAAFAGNVDAVTLLAKTYKVDVNASGIQGSTALHAAAKMGSVETMEVLLDLGARVDATNAKGNSALWDACEGGHLDVIDFLLSYGLDPSTLNDEGDDIIHLVCRFGKPEALQLLVRVVSPELLTHVSPFDGFTPVMTCAEGNQPVCLEVLANTHAVDVNTTTAPDNALVPGGNALHVAAFYGCTGVVSQLRTMGVDVNAVDAHGLTPLHHAVMRGSLDMVRALLDQEVSTTVPDAMGMTAAEYSRTAAMEACFVPPLTRLAATLNAVTSTQLKAAVDSLGWMNAQYVGRTISLCTRTGIPPLTRAIMMEDRVTVETLLALDATPRSDRFNLLPRDWYARAALKRTAPDLEAGINPTQERVTVLPTAQTHGPLFHLDALSKEEACRDLPSTLLQRSRLFINAVMPADQTKPDPVSVLKIEGATRAVTALPRHALFKDLARSKVLWEAKMLLIGLSQGPLPYDLAPESLLALALFTNNALVSKVVNGVLTGAVDAGDSVDTVHRYKQVLSGAVWQCPSLVGEAFIASDDLDRTLLPLDAEVAWPTMMSATTLWRLALDNVPSFTTNSAKGTVLLLKAKPEDSRLRVVAQASVYRFDSEVLVPPGTRFKVTKWYHGCEIALGQANVREHSYLVEKRSTSSRLGYERMLSSQKSLIIELTEQ
eukprot:m.156291 g.156291  ORF g.156291 m.156291 type:complete len:1488 (+) comp14320_c0_seq1:324-4787(+)